MNRRNILRTLFLLTLMLLLTMSTALAWSCPNCAAENSFNFCSQCGTKRPPAKCECGFELVNSYRFCPNCGRTVTDAASAATATPKPTAKATISLTPTPKPTAKPTVRPTATPKPTNTPDPSPSITSVKSNGDGTHTVRWNANDTKGPYRISYMQKFSDSYFTDYIDEDSLGLFAAASPNSFYGTTATIDQLIPGQDYWILVFDANGNYDYYGYDAPSARNFPDFPTDITLQLKSRKGSSYSQLKKFSASAIANNPNTEFGTYVKLEYSMLARARDYLGHIAITAPNGIVVTDSVMDIHLPNGKSYSYITFYSFDWYFDILLNYYDTIPTGTYTWSLYYDGMYVNSQTFTVTN